MSARSRSAAMPSRKKLVKGFVPISLVEIPSNGLAGLMYYIKERESIRLKKEAGKSKPWTADEILQQYKFTNVKRAHDRTTQDFVLFYRKHKNQWYADDGVLLYNCGVSRYFGTFNFRLAVGWLNTYAPKHLIAVARELKKRGEQVFTGAYIITSAGQSRPKEETVAEYLGGLWRARSAIIKAMRTSHRWEDGYQHLTKLPGFGGSGFMAKEVLQDFLLMSKMQIDDAETWTPMGPGARRGMNRLLGRDKWFKQPEEMFIDEVQQVHSILAPWWKKTYPKAEALTAHDVQFCLCEFDKYERTRLGDGRPKTTYDGTKDHHP